MSVAGSGFRRDPWQRSQARSRSRTTRLLRDKLDARKLRSLVGRGRRRCRRRPQVLVAEVARRRRAAFVETFSPPEFTLRGASALASDAGGCVPTPPSSHSPVRLRRARTAEHARNGTEAHEAADDQGGVSCLDRRRQENAQRPAAGSRGPSAWFEDRTPGTPKRPRHHGVVRSQRSGMIERRGRACKRRLRSRLNRAEAATGNRALGQVAEVLHALLKYILWYMQRPAASTPR
ncbi:uncharacterized protein LOC119397945 [Rhipicephalus sanguineus]|uniref:uncharacterized protein LOC119397945 n=1 Tax=Rhipicephalus sanguineus TaxID=34632 RepID=UPI0018934864|nr:uncharacterized protein LOC119397945 [Rhipicephalus sanguineus]